jgi:hypothetical protein
MTAKNLFDLTYEVATELGIVTESIATGGSATTLIDTLNRNEADDYWNLGSVWITYDAGGAGAAPQGFYGNVSDFVNSTSTVTIAQIVPSGQGVTAIAVGDRYAIADKRFPIHNLIMAVNRAVRDVGSIPTVDTTTIDTAAAQTEYTLPAAANHDLREVAIEWKDNDANDYQWYPLRNWYIQRTAAGTADTLIFTEQPPQPRDVRLIYMAPHSALVDFDDNLHEAINYKRIIYKAALHALNHHRMVTRSTDDYLLQTIQDYKQRADQADLMYPVKAPKKLGRMMDVGAASTVELAPAENTVP